VLCVFVLHLGVGSVQSRMVHHSNNFLHLGHYLLFGFLLPLNLSNGDLLFNYLLDIDFALLLSLL
jgi:hypothetical protein